MNKKSEWRSSRPLGLAIFLILVAILLILPISSRAQEAGRLASLFTDTKALGIGDLLTVIIVEDVSASNQSQLKTEESNDFSTGGGPGIGPLDFIPLFKASGASSNAYDGKGTNSRSGSIKGRMTVEVVAARPNGDLAIQGTRVMEINSEKEVMALTGLVRRTDVNPDNTVYSYNIANAKITYTGKGPGSEGSKPGLITRVLNWIF
ncbi:MAG: flagellar basal body L-ring protein FlgH [bacterium]